MTTAGNNSSPHNRTAQSRRELLWKLGGGLGGIALGSMLKRDNLLAAGPLTSPSPHPPIPQFVPRAKRVIQLFMSGAASQCDTFDYKPLLAQKHGQKWDPGEKGELFQSSPGNTLATPWGWK